MQRDQLSLLEAARRVAAGRPCLHVNEGFRAQLRVCATPEPGGGADRQRGEGYTTILTRPSQLFERMGARCRLRSGELRASAAVRRRGGRVTARRRFATAAVPLRVTTPVRPRLRPGSLSSSATSGAQPLTARHSSTRLTVLTPQ